jgi:hypothetical protein
MNLDKLKEKGAYLDLPKKSMSFCNNISRGKRSDMVRNDVTNFARKISVDLRTLEHNRSYRL